jgi:hypothetical protein
MKTEEEREEKEEGIRKKDDGIRKQEEGIILTPQRESSCKAHMQVILNQKESLAGAPAHGILGATSDGRAEAAPKCL